MKKSDIENKINRLLNEEETFMLSLILLAHMRSDEKYKNLSQLIFLFDNYKGFKQFIKFYEGQTIDIPTTIELKKALRLLALFQKVKIDNKDFEESFNELKLKDLKLSKEECLLEIDKFYSYLQKEGAITLKQFRKLKK